VNKDQVLWQYRFKATQTSYYFSPPELEIDNYYSKLLFDQSSIKQDSHSLRNGVNECLFDGRVKDHPDLYLRLIVRISSKSPVIRFRYECYGTKGQRLTSTTGRSIHYFSSRLNSFTQFSELNISVFNQQVHSYEPVEKPFSKIAFEDGDKISGPVLTASGKGGSFLLAYEHGSAYPESFVQYRLQPGGKVLLESVKGNFYDKQIITKDNPFKTIWFETAAVPGNMEELAKSYRNFILRDLCENAESRQPYLFYNTWNFQERNEHWYGKDYLSDMNEDRMLKEISVAHQIGIEVFVIDAGWFEKTGDWMPDAQRFPNGFSKIKAKLDSLGMKLGLWFNPTAAAVSSKMLARNRDCIKSMDGKTGEPSSIWGTENSYEMCLVSKYKDDFADELIRLSKVWGVTYFKWDAVGQFGCNDPNHQHGTLANSPAERENCFAFQLPLALTYIVEKLSRSCPQAIVDFDITEDGRSVGLAFLSAGKYFLMNNGPYYSNYDIPDSNKDNPNIFFYPGPARGWICRSPLIYDKWIPSALFLTHYFPDDPYSNQANTFGSLILGQNGIWGDLPSISEKGIFVLHIAIEKYKSVRLDMVAESLIRTGTPGDNPEIYEKINSKTGRGAVVLFANRPGKYFYRTSKRVDTTYWCLEPENLHFDKERHALVEYDVVHAGTQVILFGAK
jgi:alpha-galactosidase